MVFFLAFIILLLTAHLVLIENYRRLFLKIKPFTPSALPPHIFFTVIIPARNEQDRIRTCLETVLHQSYPRHLFEVIVADDFSTDGTVAVVENMQQQFPNLNLLQLDKVLEHKKLNSYKKKAIELAISRAKGEWIVTTDADCAVPVNWLAQFAQFISQNNSVFVAAPVKFSNTGSFVSIFQCLDFMSLQGITAASVYHGIHSMCNGANLTYRKTVFYEVGGFKGIDNIASGDDMLLMHKIYRNNKKKVHFLFSPGSVVQTPPMETWSAFFNQRIRWASKAEKFDDKRILAVLSFIYLFNLSFIVMPFLAFLHSEMWKFWWLMITAKTLIELRFMLPVAAFFGQKKLLWWFPIMQPFHIIYTVVAGWLGKFGKYSWKGRVVK